MQTEILREIILELIEQGRLTGVDIALDGALITPTDTEYRADGYSKETYLGCRRHRLVDQALAKLASGTKIEQQVAEDFPRWFAFDPMDLGGFHNIREYLASETGVFYEQEAEITVEREIARQAAWLARIRAHWGGMRDDVPHSFARRVDTDGDGKKEHIVVAECAVVYAGKKPVDEVAERWPARALELIAAAVDREENAP